MRGAEALHLGAPRAPHPDAAALAELNDRLTRVVLDGYGLPLVRHRGLRARRSGEPVAWMGLNVGLGDVFLMAPILRQLADAYGTVEAHLQGYLAAKPYALALLGADRAASGVRVFFHSDPRGVAHACARRPTVAFTLKPVPAASRESYLRWIWPEALDAAPFALDIHCVTLWRRMLGLDESAPSFLPVTLAPSLLAEARAELRRLGVTPERPTVAVQAASAWTIKEYPAPLLARLVELLADAGARVVILGRAGEGGALRGLSVASLAGKTGFEASMAALACCDLLIAPDSAMVHAAAALGVPSLAFFGPTAQRHWAEHYPLCFGLELPDEVCERKPCGLMVDVRTMKKMLPPGCEAEARCLAAIPPEFVRDRALAILEKRRGACP